MPRRPWGRRGQRSAAAAASIRGSLRTVDVAIVGAGFSGMTAARRLLPAGRSVVVLEARGRTGGRVHNGAIRGGNVAELGAEFRGPGQRHLDALIRAAGARTFPTFDKGAPALDLRGKVTIVKGIDGVPVPADAIAELLAVADTLEEMAGTVPIAAPWKARQAADWDSQTVATWLTGNTEPGVARTLLRELGGFALGSSASDVSLLHVLSLVHAHGGILKLISIKGGTLQDPIVGGTQVLGDYLTRQLGHAVVKNAPVRAIKQSRRKVTVVRDAGTVEAQHVIVAIPPTLAGRIAYSPPMPALRDVLTSRAPMGYAVKTFFVYAKPFWRDEGLSGSWFSDVGPANFGFDNSPPDASVGVLLAFLEGDNARRWGTKPARVRRAQLNAQLVKLFGKRAARPLQYVELDWAKEQYTRGCSSWYLPTGVLTECGPTLRAPVGRIHWAGTETGTNNLGSMDSAIAAGERAANEVLHT